MLLEAGPPCATWRLRASATIHLKLGQSNPCALTMAQLWDWTPRPTRTRLLHDVTAKPAVMSTPVNDQLLMYTPESREAIVCKFLAQGKHAIARHYCDLNLQPCKVPDVFILQMHSLTN